MNENTVEKVVEATLVLEGELRERELLEVGEKLFRLMHRGCRWVVLDFFDVPHVDYRGVRQLVARAELFRRAGGGIVLTGLTPYVARILQVGGAGPGTFDCHARIADAWAAIARRKLLRRSAVEAPVRQAS